MKFYKGKQKSFYDKFTLAVECCDLRINAILGVKPKGEFGNADCSKIELTEEKITKLKKSLGVAGFNNLYPQYATKD